MTSIPLTAPLTCANLPDGDSLTAAEYDLRGLDAVFAQNQDGFAYLLADYTVRRALIGDSDPWAVFERLGPFVPSLNDQWAELDDDGQLRISLYCWFEHEGDVRPLTLEAALDELAAQTAAVRAALPTICARL